MKCLSHFLLMTLSLFGEEPCISNIRQLTHPDMGFEKAGEAYFSPDERSIIFQAVPEGKKHYQMYVMDLDERVPRGPADRRGRALPAGDGAGRGARGLAADRRVELIP